MHSELVNLALFFACLLKVSCLTGFILVPAILTPMQKLKKFFTMLWRLIDPPRICQHCGRDYSDHKEYGDFCPDGSGRSFKRKSDDDY
jgi:hypothetical protein